MLSLKKTVYVAGFWLLQMVDRTQQHMNLGFKLFVQGISPFLYISTIFCSHTPQ